MRYGRIVLPPWHGPLWASEGRFRHGAIKGKGQNGLPVPTSCLNPKPFCGTKIFPHIPPRRLSMIIGILKEIKVHENRVSMTPAGVDMAIFMDNRLLPIAV
jgi:hypothetical protein